MKMLSSLEEFFVSLLRGTIVFTALLAILVAVGALIYAGYVQYAPEPTAKLSSRIEKIRQVTDPSKLIKELFPPDSNVIKDATASADKVRYVFSKASDEEIFKELNKFLDIVLNGSFESQKKFLEWIYGNNKIAFRWDSSIDDKNAANENNVNILWRSLIVDYAKRLSVHAVSLGSVRRQNLYPAAFDRMTSPTGQSQAPYFLVWFFDSLQAELRVSARELENAKNERAALRLTVPFALYLFAAAFSYFIFIMFLFLMISIEASLRNMSETASVSVSTEKELSKEAQESQNARKSSIMTLSIALSFCVAIAFTFYSNGVSILNYLYEIFNRL